MKVFVIAFCLMLLMVFDSQATMYGTGTVSSVSNHFIVIDGATYRIHDKVHVGTYRQSGTRVVEETRSIRNVEPGQEVRFKSVGNLVIELIILKR